MTDKDFFMTGRIYNALTKFCGKSQHTFSERPFVAEDGRIYATNTYVMVRWTPTELIKTDKPFGFEHRGDKPAANRPISVSELGCDLFFEEDGFLFPSADSLRSLFTPRDKNGFSEYAYDSKFVEPAVNLAKAIKANKSGMGIMRMNISSMQLFISIESNIGVFDVVIMPRHD